MILLQFVVSIIRHLFLKTEISDLFLFVIQFEVCGCRHLEPKGLAFQFSFSLRQFGLIKVGGRGRVVSISGSAFVIVSN